MNQRYAKAVEVGESRSTRPTSEQLTAINALTRREFAADELYVGYIDLANDQVDRMWERFPVAILRQFAETAPGCSMLIGHDVESAPIGLFFDAKVVKESDVNWLRCWYFIPKTAGNEHDRTMLDAGVYRYASIGFGAADPTEKNAAPRLDLICDICGGNWSRWWEEGGCTEHMPGVKYTLGKESVVCTLHFEGQARMVEGSIVYLGAQFGAEAKAADEAVEGFSGMVEGVSQQLAFASAARFTKSYDGIMVPRKRVPKGEQVVEHPVVGIVEPAAERFVMVDPQEAEESVEATIAELEAMFAGQQAVKRSAGGGYEIGAAWIKSLLEQAKAGRVISKANENKLRQASELIQQVLSAVEKQGEEWEAESEDEEEEKGAAAEPEDGGAKAADELTGRVTDLASEIVRKRIQAYVDRLADRLGAGEIGEHKAEA